MTQVSEREKKLNFGYVLKTNRECLMQNIKQNRGKCVL